jgi:hypothetical protein
VPRKRPFQILRQRRPSRKYFRRRTLLYTLHDLLAIDVPLKHFLLEDASVGFRQRGQGLAAFDAAQVAIPGSRRRLPADKPRVMELTATLEAGFAPMNA